MKLRFTVKSGELRTITIRSKHVHEIEQQIDEYMSEARSAVDGTLRSMTYIPGKLFSVNTTTAENVRSLFARNERAVCIFDTEAGPMAMISASARRFRRRAG